MTNPDIRRQIENIITGNTTTGQLYEEEHRDLGDDASVTFDIIPMFKDLEILVRNLECLQGTAAATDEKIAAKRSIRITSCSYAVLRIIATLKTMISRTTSETFARELIRSAMDKHFGTVSHCHLSAVAPGTLPTEQPPHSSHDMGKMTWQPN